jgi:transcriptional regulator with XRE-family HTH domain
MSETTDRALGARIKAVREQRQMTQAEFGKALGLDQSVVSRLEDGTRALTARELAVASSTLGVTIGVLLENEVAVPTLLRAVDSDDDAVRESLRIFSACIDEYKGVEALAE